MFNGMMGIWRFIARTVRRALPESRWELVESSLGSIDDSGHEWDADPAAWVRGSRRTDTARVG